MVEQIDSADDVIALTVSGKVTGNDFEDLRPQNACGAAEGQQ